MKPVRVSLFRRGAAYTVYAFCVWMALALFGSTDSRTQILTGIIGSISLLAGALTFVSSAYWRGRSSLGVEEHLFSSVGRTGVLLACTAVGLSFLPTCSRRNFAALVLIGYFTTAPLHVWLSIPEDYSDKE